MCALSTKLPLGLGIQVLARSDMVILCPQTDVTDELCTESFGSLVLPWPKMLVRALRYAPLVILSDLSEAKIVSKDTVALLRTGYSEFIFWPIFLS